MKRITVNGQMSMLGGSRRGTVSRIQMGQLELEWPCKMRSGTVLRKVLEFTCCRAKRLGS
jgi:hypothetical protein